MLKDLYYIDITRLYQKEREQAYTDTPKSKDCDSTSPTTKNKVDFSVFLFTYHPECSFSFHPNKVTQEKGRQTTYCH
jgi:hypothetical protein